MFCQISWFCTVPRKLSIMFLHVEVLILMVPPIAKWYFDIKPLTLWSYFKRLLYLSIQISIWISMWLNPYRTCFPDVRVHIAHGLSQTASPSKDMLPGHELGSVTTSSPWCWDLSRLGNNWDIFWYSCSLRGSFGAYNLPPMTSWFLVRKSGSIRWVVHLWSMCCQLGHLGPAAFFQDGFFTHMTGTLVLFGVSLSICLSVSLHMVSIPPGPLYVAWTVYSMVTSG